MPLRMDRAIYGFLSLSLFGQFKINMESTYVLLCALCHREAKVKQFLGLMYTGHFTTSPERFNLTGSNRRLKTSVLPRLHAVISLICV